EVVPDLLLEEVRLANEHLRAPRDIDQALGPFRVARVRDHPPAVFDAQRTRRGSARVHDGERRDVDRPHPARHALRQLQELEREAAGDARGAREEDLHRGLHAGPNAGWAGPREPPPPPAELPVQHEEGEPGEDRKSTRLNSSHVAISY